MKKLNIFSIFFLLLLPFLTGCSQEEIVFESELPRFELRPGYQLLEVIVPQGTLTTDKIYIIGEFNGGMDAVGDPRWELEKAADTDVKWGVYLNPADFINGKTLADGYTFYSEQQGVERSLENTAVIHTESPKVGERMNVIVYRWAEYFNKPANPDEVVHDGYAIYVVDNSGYNNLSLYAWGDAEIFGEWPGIKPTGKVNIDGVTYKYFDTGAENEGLNVNLIFNNSGAPQLADYNVTLNQDFYFELTPDGVVEFDPNETVKHDGYTIFIANAAGWEEVYVYMWGDVNDLNGGWPGMAPTGTQVIKGVTYLYFDLGAANCNKGLEEHVIVNNGNGKQFDDVVVFNLDRDVYIELTASAATEFDPATYTPEIPDTPVTPEPKEYKIYVQDMTGWDNLYVYAYGDAEVFGGWPGKTTTETKVVGANTYKVFTVTGNGEEVNLIFNNNDGTQTKDLAITLDQDYFIVLANAIQAEVTDPEEGEFKIYIDDQTGWDNFYVYAWGDKEIFGGWPGEEPTETETVDGVTYKVLTVKGLGEIENLIFNANIEGVQYDATQITLDKNYFITALPDKATVKE